MEVVLNHIDFKFFVKMIGIESFKNPKNWFQNWIKGSIQKPKKKKKMEPFQHSIMLHMWSYLVHMWGGSKYVSSFQFEGMKFKFVDSIEECSCDKSLGYKTNFLKKKNYTTTFYISFGRVFSL
jgi:hypothetical protein